VKWLQIDLGAAREFDAVVLVAAEAAEDSAPGPGYGFPMRFRVESADDEHFARHRLLADATEADFPNPATLPVFLPCPATTARYIRVTATRLGPRGRSWLFALGELMVLNGSRNLAAGCPVSASDAYRATPAWQAENATDGHTALGAPAGPPVSSTNGWHSAISPVAEGEKWVEVRLPRAAALDELRLYPARPADFPTRSGFGFPVRFRVEASATHDFAQPRTLLDATAADFLNPGENTVVIPGAAEPVQTIRVTATRLWERSGDFVFALAELEAWSGGKNLAAGAEVVSSDGVVNRVWNPAALVDGATSRWTIADWRPWLQALSERRERELRAVALAAELAQLEKAAQGRFGRWLGAGGGMLFLVGTAVVWSARRHRALAAERLRERIAADLHDEIGSQLASIALLSQVAQRREPCASAAVLAEIQSIARETSEAMRDIVWLVRPSPGSVEELVARLREVARRLLGETPWTLETTALPLTLPLEVRRHVYLFAREALRNAAAHSSAPSVQIHLSAADRHLELTIHDDGAGFDPATPVEGTGLLSLRQRAAELGGELQIDTALGTGTRLALRIPLRES
jgi:signal transduction histidine kinase